MGPNDTINTTILPTLLKYKISLTPLALSIYKSNHDVAVSLIEHESDMLTSIMGYVAIGEFYQVLNSSRERNEVGYGESY